MRYWVNSVEPPVRSNSILDHRRRKWTRKMGSSWAFQENISIVEKSKLEYNAPSRLKRLLVKKSKIIQY